MLFLDPNLNGFWSQVGVALGRLGLPCASFGVSWARLGGGLAASSGWFGGLLALGAALGRFWARFENILQAFWDRLGII